MASIFRQTYTVEGKSGRRIRKKSKYWYIDYKTADGTRKRVKAFKDKGATAQLAAKLELEAEQAQVGIIDKYKEHRRKPLMRHLEDFTASLSNRETTARYVGMSYSKIRLIIGACKFVYISDISASKVQQYLAGRRRQGLGLQTSNYYLRAIKQFCAWLVSDGRTGENPLAYLRGLNPNTDIRRKRRALTTDELDRLISTTSNGPLHHRLTGKERAMLYTLAVSTGLRAGELASLTWQSFDLSDSMPSVTVLAAYSKHRRDDTLPLRSDIARQLVAWKAEKKADEQLQLFGSFNPNKGAEMLRRDLEPASIPYEDESGRYADFHCLRHTFISNLTRSGVSPKIAQSLARHSTISLTMDVYTHLSLYDERAALDSLPELPSLAGNKNNENNRGVVSRTGTDDLAVTKDKIPYKKLTKKPYFDSSQTSSIGIRNELETRNIPQTEAHYNSLQNVALGKKEHLLSTSVSKPICEHSKSQELDGRKIHNLMLC